VPISCPAPAPFERRDARVHAALPQVPLASHGSRHRMARAVALAVLASLAACGGNSSPPPAPPPAPSPQPIPAQMTVPNPVGYDADHLNAFNRLNEIRLSAGLGMLAQDTRLDAAAQAHADWEIANQAYTHEEVAGTSGFTGVTWVDRDQEQGYAVNGGGEVISAGADSVADIDALVNVIYHRFGLFQFDPVDVGIGFAGSGDWTQPWRLVVDFSSPGDPPSRSLGQLSQDQMDGMVIWPLDGSTNVPVFMGGEEPNPVPDLDVWDLGTPASLTVSRDCALTGTSIVMTNTASGLSVPIVMLTHDNDPNQIIPSSFVAAIPRLELAAKSWFNVVLTAGLTCGEAAERQILKTWKFETAGL
jgi:uncharacterized protein YkwD